MGNWLETDADCEEQYNAIKCIQKKMIINDLIKNNIISSSFGFIYEKDNEKRVFNLEDSKKYHSELIKVGWKHIDTIDLCMYIEHLIKVIELKK